MDRRKSTRNPREGPRSAGESLTEGSAGDPSSSLPPVCPMYARGATSAKTVVAAATTARRPTLSKRTTETCDMAPTKENTMPARLPPRDAAGRFIPRQSSSSKHMNADDYSSEDDVRIPSGTKRPHHVRASDPPNPELDSEPLRKEKPSGRGKPRKTGSIRSRELQKEAEAVRRDFIKKFFGDNPPTSLDEGEEDDEDEENDEDEDEEDEIDDIVVPDLRSLGPEELRALGGRASAAILSVAARSGHLKGTFVKRLKTSANLYTRVVAELTARQDSEENQRLRGQLVKQQRRIEALEAELKAHRLEFAKFRVGTSSLSRITAPPIPDKRDMTMQELQTSLTRSLGEMIDVRLAAIEDRLISQKSHRPPQAADKSKETSVGASTPAQGKKGKKSAHTQPIEGSSKATEDESWAAVAKKKAKQKPVQKPAQSTSAAAPQQQKRKRRKPRKRKRFVERPPAVVLTIPPEIEKRGVTYACVLTRASEQVDLSSLGIEPGIRFRRSATGARVLQFPRTQCSEAVHKLAEKLDQVLDGVVEVRVPQTLVGLRVSCLDDTVTQEDVETAIVKATGCATTSLKVGPIREGPSMMGTAYVRCPVGAAKKLAETGKLLVGWSSARVRVLERRPMRCFRCLSLGHTGALCPTGLDRSALCFRCGVEGHKAAECSSATVRCAVCAAANKPSTHITGGRNCVPPKIRPNRAQKSTPTEQAPGAEEEEAVEKAAMSP